GRRRTHVNPPRPKGGGDRPYHASSSQRRRQLGEIGHDQVGLMRRVAERAAVDERRPYAIRFRADAIEGMIGNEEDARASEANDLGCLGIGLPVRLKIAASWTEMT